MNIGMIGMGFVGGTTAKVLSVAHSIFPYDRYKSPHNGPENMDRLAQNSEIVFVCVPTPMKKSGEIDYSPMHHSLQFLQKTTEKLNRNPKDILVTIRSTAVSGTTDSFAEKYPFKFAFNPEFLREKHALEDMKNTNRIVIGVEDKESEKKLIAVYQPIFPNAKIYAVNRKTAEMSKYANNMILAGQIMLYNQLHTICKAIDVDYDGVKKILEHDDRLGRNMQVPGHDGEYGFGGKCLPKDLNALIYLAREHNVRPHLLEEIWRLNLEVRKNHDWLDIAGAVSENEEFNKN